jgi:hypothetical protein
LFSPTLYLSCSGGHIGFPIGTKKIKI